MALQRDFMVNQAEFLNLFSSVYVASKREAALSYSNYYLIQVPPNNKKSIYLKFNVKKDGWFDFCIKQYSDNRIEIGTQKSRIRAEN